VQEKLQRILAAGTFWVVGMKWGVRGVSEGLLYIYAAPRPDSMGGVSTY